ncbi:hypothetical protein CDAR_235341 [Caerostris darwini]|uniref:Uncharacterized protein n=1 Tax=Caerostris darwini TaxID=1538125 RepID=A0AAV4VNZ7_9ARAC|nr:hypothetical protein CDAR_235341 [Caerostris darwini]
MLEDVTKRNRARSVEPKRAESADIKPDIRIHGSCELILEDSCPILNIGRMSGGDIGKQIQTRGVLRVIFLALRRCPTDVSNSYFRQNGSLIDFRIEYDFELTSESIITLNIKL